jgi:nicotinamidase-related amidase
MQTEKLVAELRQNYASSKAPRMGAGNSPAMLVVDFVEGFTNSASPLAGSWDDEVNNTAELMQAARHKNLPVIFTSVEFSASDLQSNLLYLKTPRIETLLQGSSWTEIDQRLPRLEQDIIISKKYGSAFFATSLAAQLQVMKIDTLLISGCVTSACVRASAVDAVQNGFRPVVVRETVGDRSVLAHEANLMDIEQRYGDVISMQEALQYIQSN